MDKIFKYTYAVLAISLVSLALMPKAFATEAVLNGIEIKPANNSYEITLNTDQAIPLKTNSPQSDQMVIELKGIMPSKSVNTVYNNASNIDHVLIQPVGDDLKITVQGLNVASSNVLLDAPKVPSNMLAAPPQTSITLNRSIDSYSPIAPEEDENNLGDILSLTSLDLKNLLTPSGMSWMVGLGMILFFLLRSMRETKEQVQKYELSPKDILRQKQSLKKSEALLDDDEDADKEHVDVYAEISKARSKFNDSLKRKQSLPKQNAAIHNYGIKEYQDSQVNPYKKVTKKPAMSQPIQQTANAPKPSLNKLQEAVQAINQRSAQQQMMQEQETATTAPSKAQTITRKDLAKAEARLHNMKFLDNMTKIYEKNGRSDLAQNIREKMTNK